VDLSYLPLLGIVPFIAVIGLIAAAYTRADRSRWSAEMKAFLGLLILSIAAIALAIVTASPPRPG
jgi:hypothetical protein